MRVIRMHDIPNMMGDKNEVYYTIVSKLRYHIGMVNGMKCNWDFSVQREWIAARVGRWCQAVQCSDNAGGI